MTQTTTDTVTSTYRSGDVSETVVMAVAEAKGVDPLDLDPLYTTVDPDALNEVFRPTVGSSTSTMQFRFSMAGCEVVVHGDGDVVVTPPTETDEQKAAVAIHGD